MSASSTPTVAPSAASASARLTAVVDLPTPPLPRRDRDDVLDAGHQLHAALHRSATSIFCVTLTLTRRAPGSARDASAIELAAAISCWLFAG